MCKRSKTCRANSRYDNIPNGAIESGFTAIELLIVISIVAILAASAIPSYSSLIANQRAKAVSAELFATLSIARSEAIKRNANVTLKANTLGWADGWTIVDSTNTVLDSRGRSNGVTITTTPAGMTGVVFRSMGRVQAVAPPMFTISTTYGSATVYQCVSVELSGRPYSKGASSC